MGGGADLRGARRLLKRVRLHGIDGSRLIRDAAIQGDGRVALDCCASLAMTALGRTETVTL